MLPVSRCPACGAMASPPRDRCAACGAGPLEPVRLAGRATVVASTWVPGAFGLEGFAADGFGVAWVDVDDGPRVQVLVADDAPAPATAGTVDVVVLQGVDLPVFVSDGARPA